MKEEQRELLSNCANFIRLNSEKTDDRTKILKEIRDTLSVYDNDKWIIPQDIKRVEYTILSAYNVSKKDKDFNSRKAVFNEIKKLIWYFVRELENDIGYPKYTLSYIGRLYGMRDHSTVYSGIEKVKEWNNPVKNFMLKVFDWWGNLWFKK